MLQSKKQVAGNSFFDDSACDSMYMYKKANGNMTKCQHQ